MSYDKTFDKLNGNSVKRKENRENVKKNGGNKFQEFEAWLRDPESNELTGDLIRYGVSVIDNFDEAKNFFEGYILDIKNNPDKYDKFAKKNPSLYAQDDITSVLAKEFKSVEKYTLWNKVFEEF